MVGQLLLRGMIAGLIAAVLAFGVAYVFGEPEVNDAIGFEERAAIAAGEDPGAEPELISRAVQSTLGLATGILAYGTAIGGLFALVFAFVYGRATGLAARATAAVLAVVAWITIVLVPQVKYGPNPPAVGSAETIGARTALFFLMLVISIALTVLAVLLARRLWAERGGWTAGLVAGFAWLAAVVAVLLALPAINEVPPGFAADSLWRFRMISLGIHAVLWAGIGLIFGALAEPLVEGPSLRRRALA